MIWTFCTFFPFASKILEIEYPNKLFLIWPKWRGLFVLGDENSTIYVSSEGSALPKEGLSLIEFIKLM